MFWAAAAASLAVIFFIKGKTSKAASSLERLRHMRGEGEPAAVGRPSGIRAALTVALEWPLKIVPGSLVRRASRDLEKRAPLSGFSSRQLAGMRFWATLAFGLSAPLVLRFSTVGLLLCPPCAALGALLPRLMARRNRERYLERVRLALPNTADMLYVYVLGGKNLEQAFRGAAGSSPEPLGALLGQVVREIELGSPMAEAFDRLKERCPLPELSSLLRSIVESQRRGTELAFTLEIYSREIRHRHRDRLRALVAKAPLKLLAPLVLLILPASVILTVGPTFLNAIRHIL